MWLLSVSCCCSVPSAKALVNLTSGFEFPQVCHWKLILDPKLYYSCMPQWFWMKVQMLVLSEFTKSIPNHSCSGVGHASTGSFISGCGECRYRWTCLCPIGATITLCFQFFWTLAICPLGHQILPYVSHCQAQGVWCWVKFSLLQYFCE